MIDQARLAFAFLGHYGRRYGQVGGSQVYQLAGFEMRRPGSSAEADSVGLLTWEDGSGVFDDLDGSWLRGFIRHNWRHS